MSKKTTTLWDAMSRVSLNATKLAAILGVSQSTISRWAYGDRTPSVYNLTRLAKALSLSLDEVVALVGAK